MYKTKGDIEVKYPQQNLTPFVGIDIGSVTVKIVHLTDDNKIVATSYRRHHGKAIKIILSYLEKLSHNKIKTLAVTGSGGRFLSELLNIEYVNEIIAQVAANACFYPEIKTIIEVGGEDAKLINIQGGKDGIINDFATNTICAAGTGSFLDQQATRLGIDISEFGKLSLQSKTPPRIAGRCTVFAKTDMIHLQQEATPTHDILAGLCNALARSFKGTICKGKSFLKPIAFEGGVAANEGMVRAFEEILELEKDELIIPEYFASLGAIGAALTGIRKKKRVELNFDEINEKYNAILEKEKKSALTPLKLRHNKKEIPAMLKGRQIDKQGDGEIRRGEDIIDVYLGVDVGSLSTDLVLLDSDGNIVSKRYLPTAGKPIDAVCRGLKELELETQGSVVVKGVGVTGSGRYLIGEYIGADVIKNEITAQARAAIDIDNTVDTIFEIGGQDSKYISIKDGIVVDFEMNKVCAAGTGSFLEEQAERLNLKIDKEFEEKALCSSGPCSMGERCTVFIASDLVHHQSMGSSTDDLAAGLSYSIVHNYLNRVVGKKKIGKNIFFQGGVAFNRGVVAAFENVLERSITVPPHHETTGAIGCAKMAMEKERNPSNAIIKQNPSNAENTHEKTKFKGFKLWRESYEMSSFECRDCQNYCQINEVKLQNSPSLYFGSRCEKYDTEKKKRNNNIPDLFNEREKFLLNAYQNTGRKSTGLKKRNPSNALKIGIPRTLPFYYDFYPFWKAYFEEIGLEVVISSATNKRIIHLGVENVTGETCFPIKVSHGHILDLIKKEVDYIFLPTVIEVTSGKNDKGVCCPYVQTISYLAKCSIDFKNTKIINPAISLSKGKNHIDRVLLSMGKDFNVRRRDVEKAISVAYKTQSSFLKAIKKRGAEVLKNLNNRAIVIVSRSYNGYDSGINFDLPVKLRNLNIQAIPMDYLPLEDVDISGDWPNMYWGYGQKILKAAKIIKDNDNLFALYLTNFGCGPDSFITTYFQKEMKDGMKPYLEIQVDEHSADAGLITRCEAFLDTLRGSVKQVSIRKYRQPGLPKGNFNGMTLYLPYMSEHAHPVAAAFKAKGFKSEVMSPSDEKTLFWGRKYTTGRECYPCIITTGDMVKMVKSKNFDRKNSAFFMPSGCGPCRFGQYNVFHRMVLDELGFEDVPIYSPNQNEGFYKELAKTGGKDFFRLTWGGVVAVDVLEKMLRKTRPYEILRGESDRVFKKYLKKVCDAITREKPLYDIMKEAKESFQKIKVTKEKLPVIGMVGEIFLRTHTFSNNDLIRSLEELGAEVKLSPMSEWLLYLSHIIKEDSLDKKDYLSYAKNFVRDHVQNSDAHRLEKITKGFLDDYSEPSISRVLSYSQQYLTSSFRGEAVLSVGKAIDFFLKGARGIVSVMPFTCMPGTIASTILNKVRKDKNDIPILNIAYDGAEETNTKTRLEAFVYQVKRKDKENV